jgi:hypothetical protein
MLFECYGVLPLECYGHTVVLCDIIQQLLLAVKEGGCTVSVESNVFREL